MGRRTRSGGWLAAAALALVGCGEPGHERSSWQAMGTEAEAEVYTRTAPDARTLTEEIRERTLTAAVDLDPAAATGELGRINRQAVSEFAEFRKPDVYRCVKLALDYARESEGAYDPTQGALARLYAARDARDQALAPGELDAALTSVGWEKVTLAPEALALRFRAPGLVLDLGELARGCALDWAARTFARTGSVAGLLRLGDAWRAWGDPPGAAPWRVVMHDPRDPQRALLTLSVTNRGVAVAGRRAASDGGEAPLYLDSRSGLPAASDVLAAVAVADSAADAAALAHALFVSGSLRGPSFLARTVRTEAILIVRHDAGAAHVLASASLEGRIELSSALSEETEDDVRYLLPPLSL